MSVGHRHHELGLVHKGVMCVGSLPLRDGDGNIAAHSRQRFDQLVVEVSVVEAAESLHDLCKALLRIDDRVHKSLGSVEHFDSDSESITREQWPEVLLETVAEFLG